MEHKRESGKKLADLAEKEFIVTADMSEASRRSAHGAIRDTVARLRHQADQLEQLSGSLPAKLPLGADEALWKMVMSVNRGLM